MKYISEWNGAAILESEAQLCLVAYGAGYKT